MVECIYIPLLIYTIENGKVFWEGGESYEQVGGGEFSEDSGQLERGD